VIDCATCKRYQFSPAPATAQIGATVQIRTLSSVERFMLRTLFRTFAAQTNQAAKPDSHAAKRIDASQLKLVSGGLPKGGWMATQSAAVSGLPKGGWC
jgi:hypothetical protein